MRTTLLVGSFVALILATGGLWTFRFVRVEDRPVWSMEDIQGGLTPPTQVEWTNAGKNLRLLLKGSADAPARSIRMSMPPLGAVEGLHLRFKLAARNLVRNEKPENQGNFHVEWHSRERDRVGPEFMNIALVCHNTTGDVYDLVIMPRSKPSFPILCLGIVGKTGEIQLSELHATVVHERGLWKAGCWCLILGWIAWTVACIRAWGKVVWWKSGLAALIWVFVGMRIVIPGPWDVERSLYVPFQLEGGAWSAREVQASGAPRSGQQDTVPAMPGAVRQVDGQGPQSGVIETMWKFMLRFRHILHVVVFFGTALALGLFVPRGPAMFLTAILAPASEYAQVLFGYGYGWEDLVDLLTDFLGIVLAMGLIGRIRRGVENSRHVRREIIS